MWKIVFSLFLFRLSMSSCAPRNATDNRGLIGLMDKRIDKYENITHLHIVNRTTDGMDTFAETSQDHENAIGQLARLDSIHKEDEETIYCSFRKYLASLIFELYDVKMNISKLEAEVVEAVEKLGESIRIYVGSTGTNEKEAKEEMESTMATSPSKLSKIIEQIKSLKIVHSELKERIDYLFEAYHSESHKTMKFLLGGLRSANSDISPVKKWKCGADNH